MTNDLRQTTFKDKIFSCCQSLVVSCKLLVRSASEAAAKVSLATVYQKHNSLLTRKWMYRG